MIKANLYINGKEADDYPVSMSATHCSQPYVKFLDIDFLLGAFSVETSDPFYAMPTSTEYYNMGVFTLLN